MKATRSIWINYAETEHPVSWKHASHSTSLVNSLRCTLNILKDNELNSLLQDFDATKDVKSKNSIASSILQRALSLATQTIINLDIGSLLLI